MELHGREQQQLQRALLAAFRRPEELAALVTFGLDQNLYAITEGGTLENRAFSLIEWATAHGRLADLVRCAYEQNPDNALLRAFAVQYLGEAALAPPPVTPATGSDLSRGPFTPPVVNAPDSGPPSVPVRVATGPKITSGLHRQQVIYGVMGAAISVVILLGGAALLKPGGFGGVLPTTSSVPLATPTGPQGFIAFTSRRGGGRDNIYIVNPAAPTPMRRTDSQADDQAPAWSPDGVLIAFDSDRGSTDAIYMIAATGGTPWLVTTFTTNPPFRRLTWSPDAHRLAFADGPTTDSSELFILDMRGGAPSAVPIDVPGPKTDVAWSPDATQLAFTVKVNDQDDIYVVNTLGGTANNLTNDPTADQFLPAWSPDSRRIAYTYRSETHDGGKGEIYMMNADGSGVVNLTNDPADDNSLTWSPDGRWIAFASNRNSGNGNQDIYILDTQNLTRPAIRITDRSWNGDPAWMPRS